MSLNGARPAVAIVILTWNAVEHTKKCLAALRERTERPHRAGNAGRWRVIVVDNGSTDGTLEYLGTLDWLTLIKNGRNLGFTKGCNIGMAMCEPDEDVVLMNNDILVTEPDWLVRLQDVAYSADDIGVVAGRLVDPQGRVLHLGSYMQPMMLMGQQMGGFERDINQCSRDRTVESVVFAQAYLRRNCIDSVGPLDEDLFAYFEDTDYCLRAGRAGFRTVCAGSVRAIHDQNTSTRANKVDFWSIYGKSREVFTKKWASWVDCDRYTTGVGWNSVVHQPMGYAAQSRELMRALHFANVRVTYRNAYRLADEDLGDLLIDDLRKRPPRDDVTQVGFCQADVFHLLEGGPRRVGWSMLEVTGLPETWVRGCNAMDEVWVPASFNVDTFRRSGVSTPIRLMPLGVNIDYFHPQITSFRPSPRFTFLSVFEWGERKAPEMLLRAFADEFDGSDDVLLLLSVMNRDPEVDVHRQIADLDLSPTAPVVLMLNPGFTSSEMGSLYRSADCFVLPSRGEGWGMPVLEAMACGLPAISTNWSGPADFLHEGIGYPLDVRSLIPAEARCPYYAGFEWADPDIDHLRALMREVYEHPEKARAKGLAAADEVAAKYSWEAAAARVKERLLELA